MARILSIVLLVGLAACEPTSEVDPWEPLTCGEGTELVGDVCENIVQGPPVEAMLDLLEPPCTAPQTGGADFIGGCANGICLDTPYATIVEEHGQGDCHAFESYPGLKACSWYDFIYASFEDEGGDGIPEPGTAPYSIQVADMAWVTAEGAGPGRAVGCMVEHAGLPYSTHLVRRLGMPVMDLGSWVAPGIYVYAEGDPFYGRTAKVTMLAR